MADSPRITPVISGNIRQVRASKESADVLQQVSGPTGKFSVGDLLNGRILSQDNRGLTQIFTEEGTFTFDSRVTLPKGSEVMLRVIMQGEYFQARIVTINGQPVADFLQHPSAPTTTPAAPHPATTLPRGAETVQDTVTIRSPFPQDTEEALRSPGKQHTPLQERPSAPLQPGDTVQQSGKVPLQPGTLIRTTLLNPESQTVTKLTARGEPFLRQGIQLELPAGTQNAATRPIAPELSRPGNIFSFRILDITLPAIPNATPATGTAPTTTPTPGTVTTPQPATTANPPLPPHGSLHIYSSGRMVTDAVVIGQERPGVSVLSTALGTVRLEEALPRGTQIEMEFIAIQPSSTSTTPALSLGGQQGGSVMQLLKFWGAFQQFATSTEPAATTLQDKLPTPGHTLGKDILKFLHLQQQGNLRGFLGNDAYEELQRARPELTARIEQDISTLQQHAAKQGANTAGWRGFLFPMWMDDSFTQAQFFIRDEPESQHNRGDKDAPKGGKRFVVEVRLEELGHIQLDGLSYTEHEVITRMDLIIRSQQPLSPELRDTLRSVLADSAAVTGLQSRLGFQVATPFPISPLAEMQQALEAYEQGGGELVV